MLRELFIQNLAIIEEARIEFHPGLNVLTGETGAGKSLLVGALELVLGERARGEWIRSGAEEARVEAVFDLQNCPEVHPLLEEAGLTADDVLVVRRTVTHAGKNRIYINDRASTLGLLETLGGRLVDIHGQHEHQSLLSSRRHRELVDLLGGLVPLRDGVSQQVRELRDLQAAAARADEEVRRLAAEKDLAAHQSAEIARARLRAGEEEELEQERKRLLHTERLREVCRESEERLYSEQHAVVDTLGRLQRQLSDAAEIDPALREPADQVETARVYLEEAAAKIREVREAIEGDPDRLQEIEERLGGIHQLKRKYRCGVEALIALGEELARSIDRLDHYEDERRLRQGKIREMREALFQAADALSRKRRETAAILERQMRKELLAVGMKETGFRVEVQGIPADGEASEAEQDGEEIRFEGKRVEASGMDRIEFLIRPNPGQEFKPLRRIASGGELSRIMLALKKVILASDIVDSLVFDEVDAGIGGKVAEVVGRKLKSLARERQVLVITHLPQIAAMSDSHFYVRKETQAGRITTMVTGLNRNEKVREVARMLAGEKVTELSVKHAEEMITLAESAS